MFEIGGGVDGKGLDVPFIPDSIAGHGRVFPGDIFFTHAQFAIVAASLRPPAVSRLSLDSGCGT
jgi:hypothetical protein